MRGRGPALVRHYQIFEGLHWYLALGDARFLIDLNSDPFVIYDPERERRFLPGFWGKLEQLEGAKQQIERALPETAHTLTDKCRLVRDVTTSVEATLAGKVNL